MYRFINMFLNLYIPFTLHSHIYIFFSVDMDVDIDVDTDAYIEYYSCSLRTICQTLSDTPKPTRH